MSALRTCAASLAILAAGTGLFAATTHGFHVYTSEGALRLSVQQAPRPLPDVTLQAADWRRLRLADFHGTWLVVGFMYTRCTTVCSIQGSGFAQLHAALRHAIGAHQVRLLSISFDPRHDAPAALMRYRQRYDAPGAGWLAARPRNEADLRALLTTFGVRAIPDGLGGYEHNAAFNIIDPQGRLLAVLDWDDPQAAARYVLAQLPAARR
ncbi:SCO family protein [Castellaniella caeni]